MCSKRQYDIVYHMKKNKPKLSKQVRISLKEYDVLRKMAYKAHKPMTVILENMIKLQDLELNAK